jgi:DNA-3-methyladenine glycosylase II
MHSAIERQIDMSGNTSLTIPKPEGFSLAESQAFLTGFRAIAGSGDSAGIDLAFALDESWEPVGVHVSDAGGVIEVAILSNPEHAPGETIGQNVARVLSLNIDGAGYAAIGWRDPVVGRLQAERPGLRPVLFPTAWEAAVWSILSQRTRRVQALAIKRRLSEEHGNEVVCPNGATLHGFPGPAAVLGLPEIRGVPLQKLQWLRGVAEGALRGELDCAPLASLPQTEGVNILRALPGIGPFSAELILARGAGNPDIFPRHEPMLHEKMSLLYGDASPERHRDIAETWRPYRSWVSLLIRTGDSETRG